MEMRTAGSTGLRLSALGLGCMGMSDFYGTRDDAQSLATIHRALDVGVTLAPAQVALAWLLAQGDDIVPIPGPNACGGSKRISAHFRFDSSPTMWFASKPPLSRAPLPAPGMAGLASP